MYVHSVRQVFVHTYMYVSASKRTGVHQIEQMCIISVWVKPQTTHAHMCSRHPKLHVCGSIHNNVGCVVDGVSAITVY